MRFHKASLTSLIIGKSYDEYDFYNAINLNLERYDSSGKLSTPNLKK